MTFASPTSINASQGLGTILNYVNDVTDSWLSNLFIIGIFIIILLGYYKVKEDFAGAFAVAGFGTFVVGLLFWIGGFVSGWTFAIVVGVALVGVIFLLVDTNS